MTLREIISDIEIIRKALSDDSDFNWNHIIYKVHQYRANKIKLRFAYLNRIDPIWQLSMIRESVTNIDSTMDPNISDGIKVSSYAFPNTISLINSNGNDESIQIRSSAGFKRLIEIEQNRFFMYIDMNKIDSRSDFVYYYRYKNAVYFYPIIQEFSALIIPENPYDVQVIESDGSKRSRTMDDPYPVSVDIAREIVLEMMASEFNVQMNMINDIINDSQEQLNLYKSAR